MPMILIESVVGDRRDPPLAARLHGLEHDRGLDTLTLSSGDIGRRRLRATSEKGVDVAIALPRDQTLFDGAILLLEEDRALVVRAAPTAWLVLSPRDGAAALALGYHAGNLHWRVRFEASDLLVALDGPLETYRARIAGLIESGAVAIKAEPAKC